MPFAVEFQEPCYFRVQLSGVPTVEQVERFIELMERDPRLRKQRACMLVDAREMRDVLTTAELRNVAMSMGRLVDLGLGPVAVVTETTFVYGVIRMFATFAEAVSLEVHPFRCMDEAQKWLEATC